MRLDKLIPKNKELEEQEYPESFKRIITSFKVIHSPKSTLFKFPSNLKGV